MKIHSRHLHKGRLRYPAKWSAQLPESNFQTHSRIREAARVRAFWCPDPCWAAFPLLLTGTRRTVTLSGVGLTMIGWKAGVTPGAATVLEMRVIMIAIPALLSMLCYVMYKAGYRLTGEFYDKMVKELRSRKE